MQGHQARDYAMERRIVREYHEKLPKEANCRSGRKTRGTERTGKEDCSESRQRMIRMNENE